MLEKEPLTKETMRNNPMQEESIKPSIKKSTDSLLHTIKTQTANKLWKLKNGQKAEKPTKEVNFFEGASQSYIPIIDIQNGIIHTADNRYVGIIEVLPVNYDKKSFSTRKSIIKNFRSLFHNGPVKLSIKVLSDISDPSELIHNIMKNCKNQQNEKIRSALNDYVNHLYELSSFGTVFKRFFLIYEYEGDDKGKKQKDYLTIQYTMAETRKYIENILYDSGNICIHTADETLFTAELLYTFFNRKTSKLETLESRYNRMVSDFNEFNTLTGMEKSVTYADLLAPKGIDFTNRNYIFMDGIYYGFLGIQGDSWPTIVPWTWNQRIFDFGTDIDVDYIFKKLPKEISKATLRQMNGITKETAKDSQRRNFHSIAEKASSMLINNMKVYNALNSGDELFNGAIILTVRAETERDLGQKMRNIKKSLTKFDIKTDDAFLCCEDYFKMTMPLLYFTSVFSRLKHNILGSSIESMYPFIAYRIFDPTGYALGKNLDNGSIVAVNNFNTNYYKNANMLIMGVAGAGKTFTEQLIGRRMFLNGTRCFFLIPKKGHEYLPGCESVDGTYIKLRPGSTDCINIMEIRPEGEIDRSVLNDDAIVSNDNLLAKKVNNIIIWIQLLLSDDGIMTTKEYTNLNIAITNTYLQFGITSDSKSIYEPGTSTLKKMPILSDLYENIKNNPDLDRIEALLSIFIDGNCNNMNAQTNVNLDNNYIVFDIDEDYISEKLFAAFLYIGFDCIYSTVKENVFSKDIVFLDEIWKMLLIEACAKQVQNMVKILRGYGGAAILATQEVEDLLKDKNDFGKSVLNNAEICLLLNMKTTGVESVQEALRLSEDDCQAILKLKRGNGMLISNGDKVLVDISATQQEFHSFDTDINTRTHFKKS